MVIYPFKCHKCDVQIELEYPCIQDKVEAPVCPNCRNPMKRIYTPPAIRFVGSGFHVNDYPKK